MNSGIKAIETQYRGYRFRSRLEARWAVFFDAQGLRWEYEPEGFDLPSGWYLPDFRLLGTGWGRYDPGELWVEVKPAAARWPDDFRPSWEMAATEPVDVWLIAGDPWPGEHSI